MAQFTACGVYDFTVFFLFILLERVRALSVEPVIQTTYLHNHNVLSCNYELSVKKIFQETVFFYFCQFILILQ